VLTALRLAAPHGVPVLGVACGSLGALAATSPNDIAEALEHVRSGEWTPHRLPAIAAACRTSGELTALNDLVGVRASSTQVAVTVDVDGDRYIAFAGDGVIVATQLGSSAYTLAAGGPVLAPGSDALVVTPLSPHGGCVRPIVVPSGTPLQVRIDPGWGGARIEVDGRIADPADHDFSITLRPEFATLVRLGGEEHFLAGLRRRGIIADSPRIHVRGRRAHPLP
jgi:NAD+ kinase